MKKQQQLRKLLEKQLRKLLRSMPDYYHDFEVAVMFFVKDSNEAMADVLSYIKNNPGVNTGDVLGYIEKYIGDEYRVCYDEDED